jgi:hypothetical protein
MSDDTTIAELLEMMRETLEEALALLVERLPEAPTSAQQAAVRRAEIAVARVVAKKDAILAKPCSGNGDR